MSSGELVLGRVGFVLGLCQGLCGRKVLLCRLRMLSGLLWEGDLVCLMCRC